MQQDEHSMQVALQHHKMLPSKYCQLAVFSLSREENEGAAGMNFLFDKKLHMVFDRFYYKKNILIGFI